MCSGFSCWMMKRLIRVCPVDNVKYKVKWPVGELAILGEGISFFMGCSKNYIMYWGGYAYYNSIGTKKSVHKDAIFSRPFMSNIDKGGGFSASFPFLMLFSIIPGPKNRT